MDRVGDFMAVLTGTTVDASATMAPLFLNKTLATVWIWKLISLQGKNRNPAREVVWDDQQFFSANVCFLWFLLQIHF